jgi:hypothetical protein
MKKFWLYSLMVMGLATANVALTQPVISDEAAAFLGVDPSTLTEGESCRGNRDCWQPVEFCMNGHCVRNDGSNRCNSNVDCWPHDCVDGICQD